MVDAKLLEMARWVWRVPISGIWPGNTCVILDSSHMPGDKTWCRVGDLDGGLEYQVRIDELVEKVRPAEADDYGYSWTCDATIDILNQAKAW